MRSQRRSVMAATVLALAALTGCGVTVPADPDGTLDRVRGGELRAGASASGQLVTVDQDHVDGSLAELIEGLADSLDARVEWVVGSEEELVEGLENGELDIAVGGMTDRSPWVERVGVTRAYASIPGAGDRSVVMLVPMGENAWLATVEGYLDDEVGR
ncbi:transporter substrate-binding domain-containing protein [Microbacterium sp. I2]|uniref:transporter substrate-binding domain-containing protein n=1 Tax=Microbacterium sp. I2 TaxID=3391826 RepID=UPI003ED84790